MAEIFLSLIADVTIPNLSQQYRHWLMMNAFVKDHCTSFQSLKKKGGVEKSVISA